MEPCTLYLGCQDVLVHGNQVVIRLLLPAFELSGNLILPLRANLEAFSCHFMLLYTTLLGHSGT